MHDHIPLTPLRELQLSEREKQFIRNNILTKQRKRVLMNKIFFASRVTGYVAVSAFWLFILVSSYIPQQWFTPSQDGPLFTLLRDNQSIVQADTIGRLLEIQWVVHVIQNGIIVPKTDIAAWEIVVLQPWAEIVVQVRATTFAKITWPAKFVLEYIPETQQTVLNLLEGKLIEVTTTISVLPSPEDTDTKEIVPSENIVIKTKLVEVTAPKDKTSSFVITQEDKKAEVVATSGNILVKQLVDLTWTKLTTNNELMVDAGNTAHIDTKWIALYTPTTDNEVVQLALESKDLQIRYQTPSSDSEKDIVSVPKIDLSDTEQGADEVTVKDDVLAALNQKSTYSEDKKILTSELLSKLTQTLHPNITRENLWQMRQRKETNIDAYIIAYSNLLDQVNYAYTLLWKAQPATSTDSLDAGIMVTQNLLTILETKYATPPSLRSSLLTIINWLVSLKTVPVEHNSADEKGVWEEEIQAKDIVEPTPIEDTPEKS